MPPVTRDALIDYLMKGSITPLQRELAQLRLEYSHIATLQNNFLSGLQGKKRVYPTVLPTQASGRWSYINPPLSGFPKHCINPDCPPFEHERTATCWDARDCFTPDAGTFWIEFDLDAVEHRIYALILDWKERLHDLAAGIDIHTPVTCALFELPLPQLPCRNPHTAPEDTKWRACVNWQGKDDQRRTISKNFTYGGQYFYVFATKGGYKVRKPLQVYKGLVFNPHFVHAIPNIQSYRILDTDGNSVLPDYLNLARRFFKDNVEIQRRKAAWMEKIRREKVARALYGSRRVFWRSDQNTAKDGFNHMIQGTVASYINETAIILQNEFPGSYKVHNKHDSLKWCFPYLGLDHKGEETYILEKVKKIAQRELTFGGNSIMLTATFHIIHAKEDLC